MKTVRKGVFETNSSSTHSLCIIDGGDLNDTIKPNREGFIVLNGGEFGWEIATYTDALTKANYLAQYTNIFPEMKSGEPSHLILMEVIKEQTGYDVVLDDLSEGYIDHQSVDPKEFEQISSNKDLIRDFIFSKESTLHTDNDNH